MAGDPSSRFGHLSFRGRLLFQFSLVGTGGCAGHSHSSVDALLASGFLSGAVPSPALSLGLGLVPDLATDRCFHLVADPAGLEFSPLDEMELLQLAREKVLSGFDEDLEGFARGFLAGAGDL